MPEYPTIRALRKGEVVDLGGIKFRMDVDEDGKERKIKPGDLYVAQRNTGPQFLTAAKVVERGEGPMGHGYGGYILSTTNDYPYDIHECVKVVEAE